MTNKQPQQGYAIGMAGLGVMGRKLVLNTADHCRAVAGYDKVWFSCTAAINSGEVKATSTLADQR